MFSFSEIVVGGKYNRGRVVELPVGKDHTNLSYYGKDVVDAFHSVYMHSEDFYSHVQETGKVRGYKGKVWSKCLFWDMDHEDINTAKKDTAELVARLLAYVKDNIRVYLSSGMVFHVLYACPELDSIDGVDCIDKVIKRACRRIAEGLVSFDQSVYDKTRIIRTENSKHGDSGLYKIPLTVEELHGELDTIMELATTQRETSFTPNYNDQSDELIDLLVSCIDGVDEERTSSGQFTSSELLDGIANGFGEGNRNKGLASVAGLLHSKGFDDTMVNSFLTSINKSSSFPLPEQDLITITQSISRYPVDDEYRPVESDKIVTMSQAGQTWYDVFTKEGDFSLGSRFVHINEIMSTAIPGDVIGIVGGSGTGKSSLGLEFVNCEAHQRGKQGLFASLEMSRAGCFFRAATISMIPDEDGLVPAKQVAKSLLRDASFRERVDQEGSNVLIVDETGLSLEQIEQYIYKADEMTKGSISSVCIDFAQQMKNADQIEYAPRIAKEVKAVAKRTGKKVFILLQTNKTHPNPYTEVEFSHLEGSGSWRQACDYILGFWKSESDIHRLHGKAMKTRWDEDGQRFDLVREGLKYHSTDEVKENRKGSLL